MFEFHEKTETNTNAVTNSSYLFIDIYPSRNRRTCGFVEKSPKIRNKSKINGERKKAGSVKSGGLLLKNINAIKFTGTQRKRAVEKNASHMDSGYYLVDMPLEIWAQVPSAGWDLLHVAIGPVSGGCPGSLSEY